MQHWENTYETPKEWNAESALVRHDARKVEGAYDFKA